MSLKPSNVYYQHHFAVFWIFIGCRDLDNIDWSSSEWIKKIQPHSFFMVF
jgi:hypothetical protein